jgi:hypothetical protein
LPSPTCTVNASSTTNGVNVTTSSTVTIQLASTAGVKTWTIQCVGTDDTLVAATITSGLSVNFTTKTATFTAPSAPGTALIFRSVVNGGLTNGVVDPNLTTTFGVYTLINGNRVLAANERYEGNSAFGWISTVNALVRSTATTSPTVTGIFPAVGFRLASGMSVTITGTSFVTGASVSIGGVSCSSVTVVNSTTITCLTGAFGTSGTKDVSVTNPSSLPGTLTSAYKVIPSILWLRADMGISLDGSSNVQGWTDQSDNGYVLGQATSGSRPPVSAAAIGGKPALNFASSKWLTNTTNNLVTPNSAWSVMCVAKNGNGAMLTHRNSTPYAASLFFGLSGTFYVYGDGALVSSNITVADATSETQSATNAFKSSHVYKGGSNNPDIFLNTTQRSITSSGTFQGTESGSTGFSVAAANGGQFWGGLIGEIVAISGAISTTDRQLIEAYQATFWGF